MGQAEMRVDQRAVVARSRELLGIHGRDDEAVGLLDHGVRERGEGGLGHEVGEGLVAPAEAGHPRPGDPHLVHGLISNREPMKCQTL